jgi:hypothetical protein
MDLHYIRHVTELGDTKDTLASEDVYSENRLKLVKQGARNNGNMFERLTQHKFLKPIDMSLVLTDDVDMNIILALVRRFTARTRACRPHRDLTRS